MRAIEFDKADNVTEAVNRQLAPMPRHVGQIILLTKMLAGDDWRSLTIPKGGSQQFNSTMGLPSDNG